MHVLNRRLRKVLVTLLSSIIAVAVGAIVLAPTSTASTVSRNCSVLYWKCLYFNSKPYGFGADFGTRSNIPSFNTNINGGIVYVFKSGHNGSSGAGQRVWNNAGGAGNWHEAADFTVFYNSNYSGPSDYIPSYVHKSLKNTYNNNASVR